LLKDMERDGWLSCRKDPDTHRTYYRLTELGLVQLSHIRAKWERVHDSLDQLLASPAAMTPARDRNSRPASNH
jgi:DNA-binding PadR family transcriptional regulator